MCCCNISSRGLEIVILIFSLIQVISAGVGSSLIFKDHIGKTSSILWLIMVFFPLLEFFNIICILCWRSRKEVNLSKNSCAICFSRLGILLSFLCIVISSFAEYISLADLSETDHPCRGYLGYRNLTDPNVIIFKRSLEKLTEGEKAIICDLVQDEDYNMHLCSTFEFQIAYISPSIYQFFALFLFIFWCNDKCRLRSRTEGLKEPIESNEENNNDNYNENDEHNGAVQYDIYGRPVYGNNIPQTVNVRALDSNRMMSNSEYSLSKRQSNVESGGEPGVVVVKDNKFTPSSDLKKYENSKPFNNINFGFANNPSTFPSNNASGSNFSVSRINGVDVYTSNPSPAPVASGNSAIGGTGFNSFSPFGGGVDQIRRDSNLNLGLNQWAQGMGNSKKI